MIEQDDIEYAPFNQFGVIFTEHCECYHLVA